MDPRLGDEGPGAFREGGITQFFDAMKRGQLRLEIALEIALHGGTRIPLGEVKARSGEPRYHQHHGEQELRAKTRSVRLLPVLGHGKST